MKTNLILAVALTLTAAACNKQATKNLYDSQQNMIENFVQANAEDSTLVRYRGSSVRVIKVQGSGDTLTGSGTLSLYYAGYVLSGASVSNDKLFWTNHEETAEAAGWTLSDSTMFRSETLKLDETPLPAGLRSGLIGVQGGEECFILFTGQYGFGKKAVGTISANSPLVYHVWVESITNE